MLTFKPKFSKILPLKNQIIDFRTKFLTNFDLKELPYLLHLMAESTNLIKWIIVDQLEAIANVKK